MNEVKRQETCEPVRKAISTGHPVDIHWPSEKKRSMQPLPLRGGLKLKLEQNIRLLPSRLPPLELLELVLELVYFASLLICLFFAPTVLSHLPCLSHRLALLLYPVKPLVIHVLPRTQDTGPLA